MGGQRVDKGWRVTEGLGPACWSAWFGANVPILDISAGTGRVRFGKGLVGMIETIGSCRSTGSVHWKGVFLLDQQSRLFTLRVRDAIGKKLEQNTEGMAVQGQSRAQRGGGMLPWGSKGKNRDTTWNNVASCALMLQKKKKTTLSQDVLNAPCRLCRHAGSYVVGVCLLGQIRIAEPNNTDKSIGVHGDGNLTFSCKNPSIGVQVGHESVPFPENDTHSIFCAVDTITSKCLPQMGKILEKENQAGLGA